MPRRKRRTKNKNSNFDREIKFIFVLILSILSAVIVYGNAGKLSKVMMPILGGIFGGAKYILPIGLFLISFLIAGGDKKQNYSKYYLYLFVIVLISSIVTIYQISQTGIKLNTDFGVIINECYKLGAKGEGGGAIGALVAIPSIKLLGTTGASIVIISLTMILSFFVFGISPAEYANGIREDLESISEERKIRKSKEREEKEKLKEEQKAENRDKKGLFSFLFKKKDKEEKEFENKEFPAEMNIFMSQDNEEALKELSEIRGEETEEVHEKEPVAVRKIVQNAEKIKNGEKNKKENELSDLWYIDPVIEEYEKPSVNLLDKPKINTKISKSDIEKTAIGLQKTLLSFGVSAKVENVTVGPTITRYELKPDIGVRVSKIANLADDIALNLAASSIRIEAPIPGKRAVGIEVPNENQSMVCFKEVIDVPEFEKAKSPLSFALGKGIDGKPVIADLDKMRHLMIAGATGSGKSVCINTIINSILYHTTPQQVKMVMIDPKVVELSNYNKIPHLVQSVVTDVERASQILKMCVEQMIKRYNAFAKYRAKDIDSYNEAIVKIDPSKQIARLVILVDELADLMMSAGRDVEDSICRIAQMGRAAGIHLIIATQRPSVDVITGLIKANIPSRIAFSVTSGVDSKTILDMVGAEKLLGKGDMLYYPMGASKPQRVQGAFITDSEIARILEVTSAEHISEVRKQLEEKFEEIAKDKEKVETNSSEEEDELLFDVIDCILEYKQASKTFLRRKFRMGDLRAGKIIDRVEELGIIGPQVGTKSREILITNADWQRMKAKRWPDLFEIHEEDNDETDENTTYFDDGKEIVKEKISETQKGTKAVDMLLSQLEDEEDELESELIEEFKFDPLLSIGVKTLLSSGNPSVDILRKELDINTVRAEKLLDQMEELEIITRGNGNEILNISLQDWENIKDKL